MSSNCPLLGPPEANKTPSSTASASTTTQLGFTENNSIGIYFRKYLHNNFLEYIPINSLTYKATGNPCLDFFFHVVPNADPRSITNRLEKAWDHDPLTTLKLICNLRAIRGTGKFDREGFFSCAIWLFKHHPRTLAYNMKNLAEFGCFKDLLEILYRLLEGQGIRAKRKSEWGSKKRGAGKARKTKKPRRKGYRRENKGESKEERIRKNLERGEEEEKAARVLRKEREAAKALARYKKDPDFRVLHDQVAEVFAKFLRSDVEFLKLGDVNKISLASKWCPNIDSSYDKTTLICESIARRVFPKAEYSEYEGVEDAHYAYRVIMLIE